MTLTDASGTLSVAVKDTYLYFGGRMVKEGTKWLAVDRLGSVRYRHDGSAGERNDYWPYGEEKPSATVQAREKFATYERDQTGLDYADQRYFTNTNGRFVTPDPAGDGMNWYAYAGGDPVNSSDPTGLFKACPKGDGCATPEVEPFPMPLGPMGGGGSVTECVMLHEALYPGADHSYCYGPQVEPEMQPEVVSGGSQEGDCGPGVACKPAPINRVPGFQNVQDLLRQASADCVTALGGGSAQGLQGQFAGAQYEYVYDRGLPSVNRTPQGLQLAAGTFIAEQDGNIIRLNGYIPWLGNLNQMLTSVSGAPGQQEIFHYLDALAASIGVSSLTSNQALALTLLHELGHMNGVPQESSSAYNTDIFNNCIKGLL